MTTAVHLVRGDEPSLVRDTVSTIVDELVGDLDRSLTVEDVVIDGATAADRAPQLAALVDAAQTPPFLTDRRVVVGRGVHLARADELDGLAGAVRDLLPTTRLVLVWESGAVPKRLADVLKSAGAETLDASPGRGARAQRQWASSQASAAGVRFDAAALDLVVEQLGEDLARLQALLATVASVFGPGATVGPEDVRPYLGQAGPVAPWELTDAIDRGHIGPALDRLHRLMGAGQRHPLQLLATLHGHYGRILALEGADVQGERDAAALIGLRGSTFPARKALEQARRLGPRRVAHAIELLAQADLDLRGAKAWPDELVMEVLVARLSNLSAAVR